MDRMVKVLNPQLAESLKKQGLTYTTETLNGITVCVFSIPENIAENLKSVYSTKDFFFSNRLNF